jgi:hypothetical protein
MKKVWKWIIGIVLGLVVLAVLVGVGFMLHSNFRGNRTAVSDSRGFSERGPGMMPYGGFEHMRGQGNDYYQGFGHMRVPGMMGGGFGFMPFGGLFGGLLCLGFLALVVLGVIWLVRKLHKPVLVEAPAVVPATAPAAVVNPCKKCGQPLQDAWNVCPNCGKKV